MDGSTINALIQLASKVDPETLSVMLMALIMTPLGVVMLVITFYWLNDRRAQAMLALYREDVAKLSQYYMNNVELVKNWERVSTSLQDQVVLNTQTMQRMVDVCVTNQFCPNARLPK